MLFKTDIVASVMKDIMYQSIAAVNICLPPGDPQGFLHIHPVILFKLLVKFFQKLKKSYSLFSVHVLGSHLEQQQTLIFICKNCIGFPADHKSVLIWHWRLVHLSGTAQQNQGSNWRPLIQLDRILKGIKKPQKSLQLCMEDYW